MAALRLVQFQLHESTEIKSKRCIHKFIVKTYIVTKSISTYIDYISTVVRILTDIESCNNHKYGNIIKDDFIDDTLHSIIYICKGIFAFISMNCQETSQKYFRNLSKMSMLMPMFYPPLHCLAVVFQQAAVDDVD